MRTKEEARIYAREYYRANKKRLSAQARKRYAKQPKWTDEQRAEHRRKQWAKRGIPEPSRPMPSNCELCGRVKKVLDLDHDHTTGQFRGWLCNPCNRAIGLLQDDADLCQKASTYLRSFN